MASFGVGTALRAERLRQGLSLAEIATQTRISERFLEAIEAENFDRLPGLVFVRNFVRQYATALKTDATPLLAQLPKVDIECVRLPDPPLQSKSSGRDPRWMSLFVSAGWFVLAGAAVVAGYVYLDQPVRSFVEKRKMQAREEAAAPIAAAAREVPVSTSAEAAAPKETEPAPVAEAPATADPAQPAAVPVALPDSASHAVQVVLTARESAWVQITADGKKAFTGTMKPNDSRSVAADSLVKVVTGNAGGIEISLNGKPIDPIGPPGQVRTVQLTPGGAELISKTPPPAAEDPL